MSTQLPPLDPRIVQPTVTDGVYLAGWQHGLEYDDKTGTGIDQSRFIPTFHVVSVGEPPINVPSESLKSPVLAKDVVAGINPTAQYWHIKRKVDSGAGSVIIKPLLSLDVPDTISAVNSDNKLYIQNIFVPPEWIIKPISTEAPLYVIQELGSERVWTFPKDGGQIVLEELDSAKKEQSLSSIIYLVKVADLKD